MSDAIYITETDDGVVDTHSKGFRIAAHIRAAEAAQLEEYRQKAEQRGRTATNEHVDSVFEPFDASSVTAAALERAHNESWRHDALQRPDWYTTTSSSDSPNPLIAQYNHDDVETTMSAEGVLARAQANTMPSSVPKSSKLFKIMKVC